MEEELRGGMTKEPVWRSCPVLNLRRQTTGDRGQPLVMRPALHAGCTPRRFVSVCPSVRPSVPPRRRRVSELGGSINAGLYDLLLLQSRADIGSHLVTHGVTQQLHTSNDPSRFADPFDL